MAAPFFLIFQATRLAQLVQACKHENCQDDSSMLQLQSRSTTLTCPHGEEEYTFADWAPKLYAVGEKPASGITITNFFDGDPSCELIAVLSDVNSGGSAQEILACDCNALVQASDGSTDALVQPCNARGNRLWGYPKIELTFDEPQDIVSATFQNVLAPFATVFSYTTTADETVEIPVPSQGRSNPSVLDLTQEVVTVMPQSVKSITVTLQTSSAFTGMKLCKGGGSLVGDPHVRTQDHGHYTVLNAGNFLAWRFNSDTDLMTKSGLKKTEVDWQIYAHYSANRRSWTRGLLLVDKSMRSERQSLELTSKECKLRKHIDGSWTTMDRSELVHVPEEGSLVTAFNFTHLDEKGHSIHFDSKKIWVPKGKKARWDAKLLMTTKRGLQPIATVQLRCFPGHHIDVQVVRERMGDAPFVGGQLGHHGLQLKREKNGLGHWFKISSDQQFQTFASWKDLGGSAEAAAYLELEDQKVKHTALAGNPSCSPEENRQARALCQRILKESRNADAEFLDECILDVCAGGAEAAELAGDIFSE